MTNNSAKVIRIYSAAGFAIGWFAVITQLYIMIVNRNVSIPETIIRFFSFFTILTNTLVALCFTFIWLKSISGLGKFLTKAKTLAAVSVYITIVGIIYNIILRSIWNPQGLQLIVDELLHSVIPGLFIVFWLIFIPKSDLRFRDSFSWLIYPSVYFIYVLIRGAISGFYPYHFFEVNILGYSKVFLNFVGIIILFMLISVLFITIGRQMTKVSS